MDMVSAHATLLKVSVPYPPVLAELGHKLLANAAGETAKAVANAITAKMSFFTVKPPLGSHLKLTM
jgi:xanthosine utilization system XapX-like protein